MKNNTFTFKDAENSEVTIEIVSETDERFVLYHVSDAPIAIAPNRHFLISDSMKKFDEIKAMLLSVICTAFLGRAKKHDDIDKVKAIAYRAFRDVIESGIFDGLCRRAMLNGWDEGGTNDLFDAFNGVAEKIKNKAMKNEKKDEEADC